jgi:hypothetical protein
MHLLKHLLLGLVVSHTALAQNPDTILLYILGGQSNMDGYGYNKDLPKSLKAGFDDVWIFHGNPAADEASDGGKGLWTPLQPGHGVGFSSDGKTNNYSDRFGIELSFVQKLKERYPNEKIALIKYSRGGTSIDSLAAANFGSWEPDYKGKNGLNQYDHYLATLRNSFAVKDIDQDGRDDYLMPAGIIWMQGESDGDKTEEIALRYYDNLKRLMDLMRASVHANDLPIVLGKISDSWNDTDGKVWDYGEPVQYAQEKLAKTDPNVNIVRATRYYKYSDPWHYDSQGYLDLGEKFAEKLIAKD